MHDAQPKQPRPLTLPELHRLRRNGVPELAARLAAGTCTTCGLNLLSSTHRALCPPEERQEPARQPWEGLKAA